MGGERQAVAAAGRRRGGGPGGRVQAGHGRAARVRSARAGRRRGAACEPDVKGRLVASRGRLSNSLVGLCATFVESDMFALLLSLFETKFSYFD